MNGRTAKKLRREVYGDYSMREELKYWRRDGGLVLDPKSLRAQYQAMKRVHKRAKGQS